MRRLALAALLLAAAAPARPAGAAGTAPSLRSGDRVVFFGDSITEQRLYTRYVQQYLAVRHPEWDIRFYNAGWGGDTAKGGLARLDRDVLSLAPTVVTLFFGMNDGGYRSLDNQVLSAYRESLGGIVKALRARSIRVVVFTPGCVDPDKNGAFATARYNDTLEALGKAALEVASEQGAASFDLFHPMLTFQAERKRAEPGFSMTPDGVHPGPAGHLVVASLMLEGLGLEPMPPLGRIALPAGDGEGLSVSRTSEAAVELSSTAPLGAGFWIEPSSLALAEACGFLDARAGQRLVVSGLAAGDWEVSVDGILAGRWTSAALSRGVAVPGTWSEAGKDVHDLVQRKETGYFDAWRNVRVALEGRPGLGKVFDGLMAADEGYAGMIRERASERRPVAITLSRAPAGENLALKKPYASSDPNLYNWGTGGLTDGSWAADEAHCFATGASPQFPKWVTIDLERQARVGTIRLGAPEFGSTKTVVVSVSADGKHFHEVGKVEFAPRKAERKTLAFEPKSARYVRLTYVDHHEGVGGAYPPEFAFTTEVEVYASK